MEQGPESPTTKYIAIFEIYYLFIFLNISIVIERFFQHPDILTEEIFLGCDVHL